MAIEKSEFIWHNGKLIPWDDATIHVMSHVVHYGSSVFEGIRCYALPAGPAIFRATEHVQRLLDSAKVYRMDVDYTRDQLVKAMLETVASNGTWPCYVPSSVFSGFRARIEWRQRLRIVACSRCTSWLDPKQSRATICDHHLPDSVLSNSQWD
jgi:branched-chain amino acid aminotransferase